MKPKRKIPHDAVTLFRKGTQWCCVGAKLQRSPVGRGKTLFRAWRAYLKAVADNA